MAKTRRVQILIEPGEYARLETLAAERGVSVAALIRRAVRKEYFASGEERGAALSAILSMSVPLGAGADWESIEEEIGGRHEDGLR